MLSAVVGSRNRILWSVIPVLGALILALLLMTPGMAGAADPPEPGTGSARHVLLARQD